MKNKLIIATVCMQMTGCASLNYPGWEQVSIERSVFNKPCELKKEEYCTIYPFTDWVKKRATIFGANTVVMGSYTQKVEENVYDGKINFSYFYCATGIPLFTLQPKIAWVVRNKFYPAATQLDFDKAKAECNYDSSKATTGASISPNLFDPDRKLERGALEGKCLDAKGFVYTESAGDEKSLAEVKKNCPSIDNLVTPCFIPGGLLK
jgi:hypothetical protein